MSPHAPLIQRLSRAVTFLVLLSTASTFSASARAERPGTCFEQRRATSDLATCASVRARALVDPTTRSLTELTRGQTSRPFKPHGHATGEYNDGIFVYGEGRAEKLIKLLLEQDAPALVSDLTGYVIAESFGGPRIHRAGHVRLPDGRVRAFIEMELIGGEGSTSLKSKATRVSELHLRRLADLVRRWLEWRVDVRDIDLIFTADEVRPIDTDRWSVGPRFSGGVAEAVGDILTDLRADHATIDRLLGLITAELLTSDAWPAGERAGRARTFEAAVRRQVGPFAPLRRACHELLSATGLRTQLVD